MCQQTDCYFSTNATRRNLSEHTHVPRHHCLLLQERIYSSDQSGQLFVWAREDNKEEEKTREQKNDKDSRRQKEKGLIRKLDFGERGAIDCIQVHGSQVFTSFDDFGSIVISDFW